jgi:hypothetical protein
MTQLQFKRLNIREYHAISEPRKMGCRHKAHTLRGSRNHSSFHGSPRIAIR